MKIFDYSFLDNGLLPANFINIIGTIYSLKTRANIRKDEHERIFTKLEKIAIVQSVKSLNVIEGIITSDERIKEIVNQNSKPLNHNENEIAGYRDALNEFHLHYGEGNGRMSRLLTLLLLYKSGFDVGKYISFEEQINNSKGNYYEALRLSSINWIENKQSYIPFIENFIYLL